MNRRGARLARLLAVAALLTSSAGCARLFGSYDIAPNGLATKEDRLRHMLAAGQAASAYDAFGDSWKPPEDEVLRALYQGVLAYYGGEYDESARVLDIAGTLADERYTKSLTRSALSVVTNDLILPYEPGRTERLMIPYYAALARMQLGDVEGAAVEARRLSMLLQLYGDDDDVLEPSVEATLRYMAGAVFEAYGDENNTAVAYRNAIALDSTLAFEHVEHNDTATGTVVIVLEQGFVAHRVEQGLAVLLAPEEVDLIANGDGDERAAGVGLVAARALEHATHSPYIAEGAYRPVTFHVPGPTDRSRIPRRKPRVVCTKVESEDGLSAKEDCREEKIEIDDAPYLLKVAWPAYRHESRPQGARLIAAGDTIDFLGRADVSDGVIADFKAERGLIVARTIARGAAKLALTKGAENKLEEKNEAAAAIIGLLGNIGNVLLERADTRSWHLLPAGISVARVNLPAGEHTLLLEAGARTIELPVTVRAGDLALASCRIW